MGLFCLLIVQFLQVRLVVKFPEDTILQQGIGKHDSEFDCSPGSGTRRKFGHGMQVFFLSVSWELPSFEFAMTTD